MRVLTLDTVESIAKRYGYDWVTFLLLNRNLKNPNNLAPKQYLYHALVYVVNDGDRHDDVVKLVGDDGAGKSNQVAFKVSVKISNAVSLETCRSQNQSKGCSSGEAI